MFSKSVVLFVAVLLGLTAHVHAHAAIAPMLGVKGAPARSDVQRPSANAPCGKTNVAATLDSSAPITAAADGSFTANVTNFNGGVDGSRQITSAKVDTTGTGKTFAATMNVTTNGDKAPTSAGTQQIKMQLPAGTKCTGGKTKNLCVASFTTAGGFGNCVAVKQAGGAAASPSAAGTRAARALLMDGHAESA